ncbi:hypothetical protein C5L14_14600 [Labrys okinawensis]|uniref:Uncharacterized protein n=1 Tax=Labrys okinawensis TaxID=346911 RepID=A0A2S9QB34_9HYPH|nr:hypothetical protein [Labrys okinawensis]PRH86561.1 hypothetical protein C5L14_14600 [Labrys okinawensis]
MRERTADDIREGAERARLDASAAQAIADCGGDPVAAVQALIVLNEAMQRELAELRHEIEEITARVSRGYARDLFYHRLAHTDRRSDD